MFDKLILHIRIKDENVLGDLVLRYHLVRCTEGNTEYWQSGTLGSLDGIVWRIRGGVAVCKFSLHKLWNKERTGKLDNSTLFTMSDAIGMIAHLLDIWRVDVHDVRVTYFEIGLNLRMDYEPTRYIELMRSIGGDGKRMFFNDANFRTNRQRTTEKSRGVRKVFKAYDKGYEMAEKGHSADGYILRLETVYKAQSLMLAEMIGKPFLSKITAIYERDWYGLTMVRDMVCAPGVRASQAERAREILHYGLQGYLKHIKETYLCGKITKKQYRTMREFAQSWGKYKGLFTESTKIEENELKNKFLSTFKGLENCAQMGNMVKR